MTCTADPGTITAASIGDGLAHLALSAVEWAPFVPVQADAADSLLCDSGVGFLLSVGIYLAAIMLVILGAIGAAGGIANRNSSQSGRQLESQDKMKSGAMTMGAGMVIAILPDALRVMNFDVPECVSSAEVYGGVLVPGLNFAVTTLPLPL